MYVPLFILLKNCPGFRAFLLLAYFFERTRSAASVRPPCLIYLSTSNNDLYKSMFPGLGSVLYWSSTIHHNGGWGTRLFRCSRSWSVCPTCAAVYHLVLFLIPFFASHFRPDCPILTSSSLFPKNGLFVWIVSAMTVTKVVEGCVYIRRRYYGILPRVGGEFEHSALSPLSLSRSVL